MSAWLTDHEGIVLSAWGEPIALQGEPHGFFSRLLNTRPMQRLKSIDQSGVIAYVENLPWAALEKFGGRMPKFSRFAHSVGVYELLHQQGVRDEKILVASLLHDVSHTAFSHQADYIFCSKGALNQGACYQDQTHLSFLKTHCADELAGLLRQWLGAEFCFDWLAPEKYPSLDCSLPHLCADRLHYTLYTARLLQLWSEKEQVMVRRALRLNEVGWFFTDEEAALKLAETSVELTQNLWGAPWNAALSLLFASAILRACGLATPLFTIEDFCLHLTDEELFLRLKESSDGLIHGCLDQCLNISEAFTLHAGAHGLQVEQERISLYPKCRAIDPLVIQKTGSSQRLSEINPLFSEKLEEIRDWCQKSYQFEFAEPILLASLYPLASK